MNPLDDNEFYNTLNELNQEFQKEKTKNFDNRYLYYPGISQATYKKNENNILIEFEKAKHRLYETRAEAQVKAKIFSNETDPVATAVHSLVDILERYEDEILADNQQMHDDVAERMRNISYTVRDEITGFCPISEHLEKY